MAKKKRTTAKGQNMSAGRPRSYGEMYKNETTLQQPTATATRTVAATTVQEAQNWQVEYSHVIRDLRTLLTVSVILFAVIIVIGFFL